MPSIRNRIQDRNSQLVLSGKNCSERKKTKCEFIRDKLIGGKHQFCAESGAGFWGARKQSGDRDAHTRHSRASGLMARIVSQDSVDAINVISFSVEHWTWNEPGATPVKHPRLTLQINLLDRKACYSTFLYFA